MAVGQCTDKLHLVLVVSGLAAAGGAAGRVAAAPDAAPLPKLLLPPPPLFMLSSSSSMRALLSKILKKRANRLQTRSILSTDTEFGKDGAVMSLPMVALQQWQYETHDADGHMILVQHICHCWTKAAICQGSDAILTTTM